MQKLKEKLMRFDVWGETTRKKKKERKQTRQTNEKTDIWSQLVKEPHWFSVGMCRLRRTKRLQHLICDIVLLQKALSLSPTFFPCLSLSSLSVCLGEQFGYCCPQTLIDGWIMPSDCESSRLCCLPNDKQQTRLAPNNNERCEGRAANQSEHLIV